MPSSAKVPQLGRPSVIARRNSYTKGPSIFADSLSKKCSNISDQAQSSVKKVRFSKDVWLSSETSKPIFSSKDYGLDALEKLQKSGEIQVIYPKQRLGHLVSAPSTATSETADKNTQF